MVPLTLLIIGLFIVGIFNLKFRQIAITLLFLLLFNRKFRHTIILIMRLALLGLRKKSAGRSACRIGKRFISKKLGIAT